jgi:ATP-dependent DNA helicase RecG
VTIESSHISPEQRRRILALTEGHFLDFKAKDIAPGKLTKTVSAFANADGGELYVGIGEERVTGPPTRTWNGFPTEEAANGHLQAFEALFPLGQDFTYTFLASDDSGLVLQVLVLKTRDVKKASDGIPYLRRGAQSLPVDTPEKLRRLELDKGIVSFESEAVDAPTTSVTNSETIIRFLIDVVPTAEPEPWLRKQQLIRDVRPTVAAVLLFADEPQAVLPKRSGVKIYRYETKDVQGSRDALVGQPVTIEGCLYTQIRKAVEQTVAIIQALVVMGEDGPEHVNYPPEALHEIITNAVLHRDYSVADDVHVRIFENRVEVESPGRLPGHVTVANILDERFARNGQIVRLINKFPDAPNKDVGEGLNTAFEAMRKMKLKDPVIEEKPHSVVVRIRHESISPPEVLVAEYLDTHDQITNRIGRELCHIGSENRMKRIFEKLIAAGRIERVPGLQGNRTAYQRVRTPQPLLAEPTNKPR